MPVVYFGMFTDEGNRAVEQLVLIAKYHQWTWPQTYAALGQLAESDYDRFGEAMDTAVREYVYDACGFKTEFYFAV